MDSNTSQSAANLLKILWEEGVFKSSLKFNQIRLILSERGNNFSKPELGLALRRASFLTRHGKRGEFEYIQRMPGVSKEIDEVENKLFSERLLNKLSSDFDTEITDLKHNFGKSGTCTAFLLRKILEKLIFLTFAKNGIEEKLKDKKGNFLGLESMINLAASEKIKGLYFLMPKTAASIKGIKFLGDTAAHNPITNVDMKSVIPQMPYIITAYEELSSKL